MLIKGIGIDIEEIKRFQKRPHSKYRSLYAKIFSKNEIAYCLKSPHPAASFAARFAAKEACVKAAGGTVRAMGEIEILMRQGRPVGMLKKKKFLVSLSHTKTHAIAVALFIHS